MPFLNDFTWESVAIFFHADAIGVNVTVSSKSLIENDEGDEWNMEGVANTDNLEIGKEDARLRFVRFIRDFKVDNSFIYRFVHVI